VVERAEVAQPPQPQPSKLLDLVAIRSSGIT